MLTTPPFDLAQPAWLALLLLPAAGAAIAWLLRRRRQAKVSSLEWFEGVPATWRVRLRHAPAAARWGALALLAIALAGPMRDLPLREAVRPGLDVLLLIDVSQSMRARDGSPDRLGSALTVARALVRARPRDRIGLLLFAGDHALACPLTNDHDAVLARLAAVVPLESDEGTALGPAIVGAVARLQAARAARGVIVALTDGTSNAGTPLPADAARLAAAANVRVLTVGVGRDGPVPFPTELGLVDVPLGIDEATLRAAAEAAAGLFVRADAPDSVDALAASLDRVEPREQLVTARRTAAAGAWLGPLAAMLLVVELLLAGIALRRWT